MSRHVCQWTVGTDGTLHNRRRLPTGMCVRADAGVSHFNGYSICLPCDDEHTDDAAMQSDAGGADDESAKREETT